MMAARSLQAVIKPHVPLIKFRKGGEIVKQGSHQMQVKAANNEVASSVKSFKSNQIAISDDLQLPSKYSRKPLSDIEIQYVMRGGPE